MLWTIIKQIFWIYNNNIDRCIEYIWNEGYFNTYPSPPITNHSMYNSIPKRKYMMDSFDNIHISHELYRNQEETWDICGTNWSTTEEFIELTK